MANGYHALVLKVSTVGLPDESNKDNRKRNDNSNGQMCAVAFVVLRCGASTQRNAAEWACVNTYDFAYSTAGYDTFEHSILPALQEALVVYKPRVIVCHNKEHHLKELVVELRDRIRRLEKSTKSSEHSSEPTPSWLVEAVEEVCYKPLGVLCDVLKRIEGLTVVDTMTDFSQFFEGAPLSLQQLHMRLVHSTVKHDPRKPALRGAIQCAEVLQALLLKAASVLGLSPQKAPLLLWPEALQEHMTSAASHGLLQVDAEWHSCLREAATHHKPSALRLLFATILVINKPCNSLALWEQHKAALVEQPTQPGIPVEGPTQQQLDYALQDIAEHLRQKGKTLEQYRLPVPPEKPHMPGVLEQHTNYSPQQLQEYVTSQLPRLNKEQRRGYRRIMRAVRKGLVGKRRSSCFFLGSAGGCGKTFLFNLILRAVRAQGKKALAVASTGIAALLLDGGGTAHSVLRIPIPVTADSICGWRLGTEAAERIRQADIIIWDEFAAVHRYAAEAVDRTFRILQLDPIRKETIFGGKVMVFGGDHRQLLPIVPGGSRSEIVQASVRNASFWPHITQLRLTENMRVTQLRAEGHDAAAAQQDWVNFLLEVGEGEGRGADDVKVPNDMLSPTTDPKDLIHSIFGDLANDPNARDPQQLTKGAILTPKNDDVNTINNMVMQLLPGKEHVYHSTDSIKGPSQPHADQAIDAVKFINSLQPQGMPPHELKLKVGASIMVLCNLNPSQGLANGTRLIVQCLHEHVICAKIATGVHAGQIVFIPRMACTSDDRQLPIRFTRFQFPVRPAFAMTINKSQGQTLQKVGIYLPEPVFSHGQLYVALSRVGERSGVVIMVVGGYLEDGPEGHGVYIKNVVWDEVLD